MLSYTVDFINVHMNRLFTTFNICYHVQLSQLDCISIAQGELAYSDTAEYSFPSNKYHVQSPVLVYDIVRRKAKAGEKALYNIAINQ